MKAKSFFVLLIIVFGLAVIADADSTLIQNPANGHWYQRIDINVSWSTAKVHCEGLGSYLTIITSQSENDFVYFNLVAEINNFIWLGGTDEEEEGVWKWVTGETFWIGKSDGSPVDGAYTNWTSDNPSDTGGGQDYLAFFPEYHAINKWDDFGLPDFDHKVPFICEWNSYPIDPNNIDDDEDGLTENQGDCDDVASSCTTDCTTDSDSDGAVDCLDLCTDIDLDDYGVDESTTIIGDGTIPIGSCTTDGVIPCTFSDGACLDSDCDDTDPTVNPDMTEIPYNCVDNDCNVSTPYNDLDGDGYGIPSDCNDNDSSVYPNASEIKHDGLDQDCNGYDLSIDIIKAEYDDKKGNLRVEATSSIGELANLYLEGFGPMEFKGPKLKWVINIKIGEAPGTATVCGIEGCETVVIKIK